MSSYPYYLKAGSPLLYFIVLLGVSPFTSFSGVHVGVYPIKLPIFFLASNGGGRCAAGGVRLGDDPGRGGGRGLERHLRHHDVRAAGAPAASCCAIEGSPLHRSFRL